MVKAFFYKVSKKVKLASYFTVLAALIVFILIKPHAFIELWLSKDQQGALLFHHGNYQQASKTFSNIHWQAYSAYASEDFNTASTLYSQLTDQDSLLAQANALAHARHYLKARDLYQEILTQYPQNQAAKHNMSIVQQIIDEVNLLSKAQQAEQGESIKELGDEPQTGDGAERKTFKASPETLLTAEQLLLDPNINAMWLRQVQKDPERFLAQKFHFQQAQRKAVQGKPNEQ